MLGEDLMACERDVMSSKAINRVVGGCKIDLKIDHDLVERVMMAKLLLRLSTDQKKEKSDTSFFAADMERFDLEREAKRMAADRCDPGTFSRDGIAAFRERLGARS